MIKYRDTSDITERALILIGELLVINLVLFALYYFYFVVTGGFFPGYKRVVVTLSVIYFLCNLHTGAVVHKHFVMGEQISRRVFLNVAWYFLVSIFVMWTLHWPLLRWEFIIPYYIGVLVAVMGYRKIIREIVKHLRRNGFHRHRIIAVGYTSTIEDLLRKMSVDKTTGYTTIGYFAEEENPIPSAFTQYLGKIDDVLPWLEKNHEDVDQLFCALSTEWNPFIHDVLHFCENHIIRFYSIPTNFNYTKRTMSVEIMAGIPVFSLHNEPLAEPANQFLKRSTDVICSILFLIFIFPIIFVIFGTLIKLSSPGPVFFKQKRSGLGGKEFWCYKFRSMQVNEDSDEKQATIDDPRKTRVGAFMRKTNIDELPQFINVLRGEMSMVGPRPHMIKHTDIYSSLISNYMLRHYVKPGITGYAQVTGYRGETDELWKMEGRIQRDIWYIEHWNPFLDLWIICKTIVHPNDIQAY